jgi:hypothetical protein
MRGSSRASHRLTNKPPAVVQAEHFPDAQPRFNLGNHVRSPPFREIGDSITSHNCRRLDGGATRRVLMSLPHNYRQPDCVCDRLLPGFVSRATSDQDDLRRARIETQ